MNAHTSTSHGHHGRHALRKSHAKEITEITGKTSGVRAYSTDELQQILTDAAQATGLKYPKLLLAVANHEARPAFNLDNLADGRGHDGGIVSRGLMQIALPTLIHTLSAHKDEMQKLLSPTKEHPDYAVRFKAALDWMGGDHSHATHEALKKAMYDPMLSATVGARILIDCEGNSPHPGRAYLSYVHPAMAKVIYNAPDPDKTALQLAKDNGIADAVVTNNPDVFGPYDARTGTDTTWAAQKVIEHNDKKFEGVVPKEHLPKLRDHHHHGRLKATGHTHHHGHHHKHRHHHPHHHTAVNAAAVVIAPAAPPVAAAAPAAP